MVPLDAGDLRTAVLTAALTVGRPLAVRFCPVTPNHGGGMDSAFDVSFARAVALAEEAAEVEPEGEVVLMRALDAVLNGILTPSSITVGVGHDGATAGKKSKVFALTQASLDWAHGVIAAEEVPFIESVATRGDQGLRTWLVQARSGPRVPATLRYVPEDLVVARVHYVYDTTDMVTWADTLDRLPPNTVIVHRGGNLSSHYAVHAVLARVPFLCEGPWPHVGDRMPAEEGTRCELDPDRVSQGFEAAMLQPLGDGGSAAHSAVFTLHNLVALLGQGPQGSYMAGAACCYLIRLGMAACLGELRHATRSTTSRERAYQGVLGGTWTHHRHRMAAARYVFWYGRWEVGFGGPRWAVIADHTQALDRACVAALKDPAQWATALKSLNAFVNLVHNGGWFLDKFVDGDTGAAIAGGQVEALLQGAYCSYELLEDMETSKRALHAPEALADFTHTVLGSDLQHPPWRTGGACRAPCSVCKRVPRGCTCSPGLQASRPKTLKGPWLWQCGVPGDYRECSSLTGVEPHFLGGRRAGLGEDRAGPIYRGVSPRASLPAEVIEAFGLEEEAWR